jgi:hypothetical protein
MVVYRARRAAQNAPRTVVGAPGYAKWRKAIQEAHTLLSATYDELDAWMKDRSERWQEGDRAGDLDADRDRLWEILDGLDDLSIRGKA